VITERVAVAGFLAGYTGNTRTGYTTDLRIFARWMENEGRMAARRGRFGWVPMSSVSLGWRAAGVGEAVGCRLGAVARCPASENAAMTNAAALARHRRRQ
jgi:hypothetical protein